MSPASKKSRGGGGHAGGSGGSAEGGLLKPKGRYGYGGGGGDDSRTPLESTYYPLNPSTGRGPWNKIIVIGDIHGDLDQAMLLMRETGVLTHQPEYYSNMVLEQARKSIEKSATGGGPSPIGNTNNNDISKNEKFYRQKVDNGLGDFVPKDLAANMIYNKRGYIMGGATIDEYHWTSGLKALVVIVGDALNVGPDDIAAVTLIRRLTREADIAGGKVVYLLGNHEVMNLRGDFSGVHPWSYERTGGSVGRKRLLSTKTEIGRFLRSRPAVFYYDGMLFMHGGLMPAAVNTVVNNMDAADGKAFLPPSSSSSSSSSGPQQLKIPPHLLADTINRHVRTALFNHEDDLPTMAADPIAATVINVDYAENGKNGILLVHPLELCDKVKRANNMTGIATQVVGHTPHSLPTYSYCDGGLFAIDMKNSKWKAGATALPAALVLLREEVVSGPAAAGSGYSAGAAAHSAVRPPLPPSLTSSQQQQQQHMTSSSSSSTSLPDPSYRWSSRLLVPKVAFEQTQARVGGWTSISIAGYFLWVAAIVATCELIRFVYRRLRRQGKMPDFLTDRTDRVSTFCDVVASYMPCAGSLHARGMAVRADVEDGEAAYHDINGTGRAHGLKPTKSAPF